MEALSGRVTADQRAYAAAVNPRDVPQIDEEIVVAVAEQRLDALLELLRRPSGHEAFLGRRYPPWRPSASWVTVIVEWMADSSTRRAKAVIALGDKSVMANPLLSSTMSPCTSDGRCSPSAEPSRSPAATGLPVRLRHPRPRHRRDNTCLVGAGDIAVCGSVATAQTAALLDRIDGTVFTAGDNAYFQGSAANYRDCYEPTWGRHKHRTRPSPGNHEYETAGGAAYFDYFGPSAGPPGLGYYSFEAGPWHVVSLNSNVAANQSSPQYQWLANDLAGQECPLRRGHLAPSDVLVGPERTVVR